MDSVMDDGAGTKKPTNQIVKENIQSSLASKNEGQQQQQQIVAVNKENEPGKKHHHSVKTRIEDVPGNHRGWLKRWTNYVKGYRRRYFVVNGPFLEYYQNEQDFGIKECASRIDIRKCFIRVVGDLNFIIIEGNKKWFIKSDIPSERSKWIVNIQNIKVLLNESVSQELNEHEKCMFLISQLESKLKDLIHLNKELQINGDCLLSIFNQYVSKNQPDIQKPGQSSDSKIFFESMCNYRSQTSNFKNYVSQMVALIIDTHKSMQSVIACEIKERQNLEAIIDAMAEKFEMEGVKKLRNLTSSMDNLNALPQDSTLRNIKGNQALSVPLNADMPAANSDSNAQIPLGGDSSDSFREAMSHNPNPEQNFESKSDECIETEKTLKFGSSSQTSHVKTDKCLQPEIMADEEYCSEDENEPAAGDLDFPEEKEQIKLNCTDEDLIDMSEHKSPLIPCRRTAIEPRKTFSIVSILKQTLKKSTHVKDLSRISMPVHICEPLSYLQRMSECMQNSYLLDKAAQTTNLGEELVFISTFIAASYSSSMVRINKPFNPLLFETYEWDRTNDLGWKLNCEQVSHHPPTSALHAESDLWELTEDCTLKSNISLTLVITVRPEGCSIIKLKTNGNIISITRPNTKVNGITYGRPWIENSGECDIINHTTGYYCKLIMKEASWTKYSPAVEGIVYSPSDEPLFAITGLWNKEISYGLLNKQNYCDLYITIWKETTEYDEDRRLMYNMPDFALQMNEFDITVGPTDTRHRKDVQALEKGLHEQADQYKFAYEEEQRRRRFAREKQLSEGKKLEEQEPTYFVKTYHPIVKRPVYASRGTYWKEKAANDWKCPIDIFKLPNSDNKN